MRQLDPVADFEKLGTSQQWVVSLLSDGEWWTLSALAKKSGGRESGISARIRDMRKARYCFQQIDRRRGPDGTQLYRWVRSLDLPVCEDAENAS